MNNKTRLIILISSSEAGGAQVYIVNLVERLKDLFNIVVVCPRGYLFDRLAKNHIEVVQSDISLLNIKFIRKFLRDQQKQYKNIIVNTHLLGTTFWTIVASLCLPKYRLVSTIHQPIVYDHISIIKKITFPVITKYISRYVAEFISVSKEIAESVFEYTGRNAHYIPNSVPNIPDKKVITGLLSDKIVKIGFFGRLTPQKNPFCFLKAAKLITEKMTKVHFYLIGDGELRESLIEQVRQDGLENYVTFTGFINEPMAFVKDLDIIVFSSDFEGTPLALLEAMSMGVPVVSTMVGGIPQVIEDSVDGLLVLPRKPEAIRDAVLRLVADNELYQRIHQNSIKKMQTVYNYEKNVMSYQVILNGENK